MTGVTEQLRDTIYEKVKPHSALYAAMFLKNWKRYKLSAELFLTASHADKTQTILDYGCGFPFVAKILTELGYSITCYEPYAGENELFISGLLDMDKTYTTKLNSELKYNHILLIDVIEHLSVIKPVMKQIYNSTKENGTLFISTPNVLRFDMWTKFLFRKTGHPQSLNKFLTADDNFRNHQREFTIQELITTVKHFGFNKIVLHAIRDTQPSMEQLNMYHTLLGEDFVLGKSLSGTVKNMLIKFLPASYRYNNLFVLAQKS